MSHDADRCGVCDELVEDGPWLGLNRYAYGTGRSRGMTEVTCDDEYLWHQDVDGDPEDEYASLTLLHWPTCALLYIEAKMSEADVEVGGATE